MSVWDYVLVAFFIALNLAIMGIVVVGNITDFIASRRRQRILRTRMLECELGFLPHLYDE